MLPVLALAVALIVSGCGGSGDSSETAATGTTASAGDADVADGGSDSGQQAGAASGQARNRGEAGNGGEAGTGSGANGGSSDGKQPSAAKPSSKGQSGSKVPQPTGEPEQGITPEQRSKATTASVTLESPSFAGGSPLPAQYTCDGRNESPPLRWSGVPGEAAELVLFALNMNPVDEALFFDWAVAGLDPSLDAIEAGKLPAGAVEGTNNFGKRGYSLCLPQASTSENYIFMLYAIPKALDPKPGFDPLPLREEVLAQSGNVGLLSTTYAR